MCDHAACERPKFSTPIPGSKRAGLRPPAGHRPGISSASPSREACSFRSGAIRTSSSSSTAASTRAAGSPRMPSQRFGASYAGAEELLAAGGRLSRVARSGRISPAPSICHRSEAPLELVGSSQALAAKRDRRGDVSLPIEPARGARSSVAEVHCWRLARGDDVWHARQRFCGYGQPTRSEEGRAHATLKIQKQHRAFPAPTRRHHAGERRRQRLMGR